MNRISNVLIFSCVTLFSLCGCKRTNEADKVSYVSEQYSLMLKEAENKNALPRTILPDGTTQWTGDKFEWTMGFFPGSCWLMYELTNETKWKEAGCELQKIVGRFYKASSHDLGFVFNCSYGNAFRLTNDSTYIVPMIKAAKTLVGRFDHKVGLIKSWNVDKGWQSQRGWQYPVIIDNMMNLELLFKVASYTNDSTYYNIAVSHADNTMKNHYREDMSCYHVVDYDSITGAVRKKETAQGYSDDSSWARGQAWGLYGYTMCYRFTKDKRYLDFAQKIASYIMNEPSIPADCIPYWDYDDPKIPNVPRDASAASVTASALLELSEYSSFGDEYKSYAEKILKSLKSPEYLANVGTNNYFLLKHSVGSIPHGNEIDVPLNYADYYFLEALLRNKK